MPQPIVVNVDSGLGRGIEIAGSALGQAFAKRSEERNLAKKREVAATTLNQILETMPENPSAIDVQKAFLKASQNPNIDQGYLDSFFKSNMPLLKMQLESNEINRLIGSSPISTSTAPQTMTQRLIESPQGEFATPMQPISQVVPEVAQQPMTTQQKISQTNDDQLRALSASNNPAIRNLVNTELKLRENKQREFREDRAFHAAGAKAAEEKAMGMREALPRQKMALNMARNAVQSGEVGALSLNNLAERIGLPELKTASGAQLITASKESLLGNLSRVSARGVNQWFEQRLNSMFPQIGQSKEANETILAMLSGEQELSQLYLDTYDRLAKEDITKYGYPRNDLDRRTYELIKNDEEKIMNKVAFQTREIYEQEKGNKWLNDNKNKKVPNGTILTPEMASVLAKEVKGDYGKALEKARKLGYTIATAQEMKEWR